MADRFLRVVGLPGHAFLPLVVGFGCNVPAVAGTRVLADARHRLRTVLLIPFISCSARLTVYVLLADVFFGRGAGTVVFAMYVLSCVLVVGVGLVLPHTVLRAHPPRSLLLELPAYQRPALRVVVRQTWQRPAGFLRTAGGIIVVAVTAVWLLTALPAGRGGFGAVAPADSWFAVASRAVAPAFGPAGFADWHTTMAQTYGSSEPDDTGRARRLGDDLRATFDRTSGGHPLPAVLAFLVFLPAYTPCVATPAAQRAEVGSRWTLFGVAIQLGVAWLLAVAVFQVGRLLL